MGRVGLKSRFLTETPFSRRVGLCRVGRVPGKSRLASKGRPRTSLEACPAQGGRRGGGRRMRRRNLCACRETRGGAMRTLGA